MIFFIHLYGLLKLGGESWGWWWWWCSPGLECAEDPKLLTGDSLTKSRLCPPWPPWSMRSPKRFSASALKWSSSMSPWRSRDISVEAKSARVSEAACPPPASTLSAGGEGTVESGLGCVLVRLTTDLLGSYIGMGVEDNEDGSIAIDHDLARLMLPLIIDFTEIFVQHWFK